MKFNKEALLKALNQSEFDGWAIYDVKKFTDELGFNRKDIEHLIKEHKSDFDSHKSTIYKEDGNLMVKCKGIYALDFLYWLCEKLDINTANSFMGRGYQARFLTQQLLNVLPDLPFEVEI